MTTVKLEIFQSGQDGPRFTYEGRVVSSKLSDEEIVATGNFMMLRDTQLKRFITNDKICSYIITVSKLAPKRRAEERDLQDEMPIEDPPGQQ